PLDELDRMAGRVAEVDRPPTTIPLDLALDLDPAGVQRLRPRIKGALLDAKGDVARAARPVRWHRPPRPRRTRRVEDQQHTAVVESKSCRQLIGPVDQPQS